METVGAVLGGFALLLLLASVAVLLVFPFLRRDKWTERRRKGLCTRCGYDLRASRERCPECGLPVPPTHRPWVGDDADRL